MRQQLRFYALIHTNDLWCIAARSRDNEWTISAWKLLCCFRHVAKLLTIYILISSCRKLANCEEWPQILKGCKALMWGHRSIEQGQTNHDEKTFLEVNFDGSLKEINDAWRHLSNAPRDHSMRFGTARRKFFRNSSLFLQSHSST